MSSSIRPGLLREMTTRRLLEVLQDNGPSSRADLTRHSGISAPTVSKTVTALLASGLIEEGDSPPGTLGRPGRRLRLATEATQVAGIVLDADRCELVTARLDGVFHEESHRSVEVPDRYEDLIAALVTALSPLVHGRPASTLSIGISTPGLLDRERQQIVLSPNLALTDGRSPGRDLADALGVECRMLQESHALCLSERMYGGARGCTHFAMIDAHIGLGLGVMDGERLMVGHRGFAGEIGHLTIDPEGRLCGCGNRGCLETVATDSALARLVSEKVGRELGIDAVIEGLRSGDLVAAEELEETGGYLAIAIAAVVNLFNPEAIFIHSRIFDSGPSLFDRVAELARGRALSPALAGCRIVRAKGKKLQGAIAGALDRLVARPGDNA